MFSTIGASHGMNQFPLSSGAIISFNNVGKSTRVLSSQLRNLRLGTLTGPRCGLELKGPPRAQVSSTVAFRSERGLDLKGSGLICDYSTDGYVFSTSLGSGGKL